MSALEKAGHWIWGLGLLEPVVEGNQVTYGAAIAACARGAHWTGALEFISEMSAAFLEPNLVSSSAAVSACEKAGHWQAALRFLSFMILEELTPDCICFTSCISSCERGGHWELALRLLLEMQARGLRLDAGSLNACISACATGGQWHRACDFLGQMPEMDLWPDTITYSAVIAAADKCEKWSLCFQLLWQCHAASLRPDLMLYNCVLHSLGRAGRWRLAFSLLREMPEVNELSYRAVLVASPWALGLQLWSEMCGMCHPSAIAFSSCILACASQDQWQAAGLLLEQLLMLGFPYEASAFEALVEATHRMGSARASNRLLQQWSPGVVELCRSTACMPSGKGSALSVMAPRFFQPATKRKRLRLMYESDKEFMGHEGKQLAGA